MTVEYIRYLVDAQTAPAFEDAYAAARTVLDGSAHCLGYELARCVEEPAHYILRIEWDSLAGHMEGFRRSPEFQTFFRHVRPYINNIEEMRHYEVTAISRQKKGAPVMPQGPRS